TRTRRRSSGATRWCGTSTSSTPRTTCSPATGCGWTRRTASGSGESWPAVSARLTPRAPEQVPGLHVRPGDLRAAQSAALAGAAVDVDGLGAGAPSPGRTVRVPDGLDPSRAHAGRHERDQVGPHLRPLRCVDLATRAERRDPVPEQDLGPV